MILGCTTLRLDFLLCILVEPCPLRERDLQTGFWVKFLEELFRSTTLMLACRPIVQFGALFVNEQWFFEISHTRFHAGNKLVIRRRPEHRGLLSSALCPLNSIIVALRAHQHLCLVARVLAARPEEAIALRLRVLLTSIPRIQQIVRILDLGSHLLFNQLLNSIRNRLWNKF